MGVVSLSPLPVISYTFSAAIREKIEGTVKEEEAEEEEENEDEDGLNFWEKYIEMQVHIFPLSFFANVDLPSPSSPGAYGYCSW